MNYYRDNSYVLNDKQCKALGKIQSIIDTDSWISYTNLQPYTNGGFGINPYVEVSIHLPSQYNDYPDHTINISILQDGNFILWSEMDSEESSPILESISFESVCRYYESIYK